MDINLKLNDIFLQEIVNIYYNMGDHLFDIITYLLNYSMGSKIIWRNNMFHL
jgi:hypothetical protein